MPGLLLVVRAMARLVAASVFVGDAWGQQAGQVKPDQPMPLTLQVCSYDGCTSEAATATLDANWRWLHDASEGGYLNCYSEQGWNPEYCPDAESCARNCAFDGVDEATYADTYGVHAIDNGLKLNFKTNDAIGSRLYVMDSPETYKLFQLKNKELSFDVDVSTLGCGMNAAVYLIAMDQMGWKGMGYNTAGAKYGMGYCDAQCRYDMKFVGGSANLEGNVGSCCTELDLFEGNRWSQQLAMHPCDTNEPFGCTGAQCGDNADGLRYQGACDKDGCDYNAWRMGYQHFYGPNGETIDSTKSFTVVTQFLTIDGTDTGDLSEIRRYFVQDGHRFDNPESSIGSAISDEYCADLKQAFPETRNAGQQGEFNQFRAKGGMAKLGQALERGLVLALSVWDDPESDMRWLDSDEPLGVDPVKTPGVRRGPCSSEYTTEQIRQENANAAVYYANLRYGPLGTTQTGHSISSVLRKNEEMPEGNFLAQRLPAAATLAVGMVALGLIAAVLSVRRTAKSQRTANTYGQAEVDPFVTSVEEEVDQ